MDQDTEAGKIKSIAIDEKKIGFHFDAELHRYTFEGTRLPSVTEILKYAHLIDDRFFTEEARARGTAVHTAVLFEIQGDLGEVHPIIQPYVDAWISFRKATRIEPIAEFCEIPQYHPIYFYGGTPDIVAILNGRKVLIDIKTGTSQAAQYQLAAYQEFPEMKKIVAPEDRFSLKLNDDGTFRLQQYSNRRDFTIFFSSLNLIKLNGGNHE